MKRRRTATSTFGVGARQSHDATRYYDRALLAPELSNDETINVAPEVDRVWCQSSEDMSMLPDNSVALMVTSPEYHVGKDYEDPAQSVDEYLALLEKVFTETYRVLEPGGRVAINVANLGRKPYVRLNDLVAGICAGIGFMARGEILWVKARGASGSIAVGSYMQPSNPVLRDVHEYVLVVCKGSFKRALNPGTRALVGLPHEATITKEDFLRSTLSVWEIRPESARRVGHPAPFPVELPRRLIELYTYRGDLVLDPFIGSGTTAVAAVLTDRRYAGFDINPDYVARAEARIAEARRALVKED